MTFFDKPRANPGIARILLRFLSARGPTAREALLRAVAPPDNSYTGSPGNALDETLDVCLDVGIIHDGDGEGLLAANTSPMQNPANEGRTFRRYVQRVLFGEIGGRSSADPTDLSQALAWFLRHDPLQPFYPFGSTQGNPEPERTQDEELGFANRVIKNNAQWGSFVRWATFLGFATQLPARRSMLVAPDPTIAVSDAVSQLSGSYAPHEAARQLALSAPVLDGGSVRVALEQSHGLRSNPAISASLSCALRALGDRGLLRLENRADAPDASRAVLSVGDDAITVAAVVIGPTP